jgi:hypothetical protein
MQRSSSLTRAVLAICCLMAPASPASAQGPYYAMPAWDQTLPASTSFVLVRSQEFCTPDCHQIATAILDRETGLGRKADSGCDRRVDEAG